MSTGLSLVSTGDILWIAVLRGNTEKLGSKLNIPQGMEFSLLLSDIKGHLVVYL